MAIIDFANRALTAKVIYFGAVKAGVSTNVQQLHKLLEERKPSPLKHFGSGDEDDLSWCFEYVPRDVSTLAGFDLRVRVFSLQSGRDWEVHRDEVLAGADAVVFVADARPGRAQLNGKAVVELEYSLSRQDLELASLPVVIQVNHSDAPDARPPDRVVQGLNPYGFPVIPSIARDGKGVLATHGEAIAATLARLRDNLAGSGSVITLTALTRAVRERNEDVIRKHLAAIDARPPRTDETGVGRAPTVPPPPADFQVQPIGLRGHTPLELVRAELKGRRIYVDFIAEPPGGEAARRWTVVLDTDGSATTAPAGARSSSAPPPRRRPRNPLIAREVVSLWFGIAGLFGGLVSGVLLGFLLFG